MKRDIILAGVGGQGLLSIAAVIAQAAMQAGLYLKQAEVHGMAQRGGVVQSHVRICDSPIHSDLIRSGCADLILATEPMEALRYLPFLSKEGMVVSNLVPLKNIDNYPPEALVLACLEKLEHRLLIDAVALAEQAGSIRCTNMVLLGAATSYLGLSEEHLRGAIASVFSGKGTTVIETNLTGFWLGLAASRAT